MHTVAHVLSINLRTPQLSGLAEWFELGDPECSALSSPFPLAANHFNTKSGLQHNSSHRFARNLTNLRFDIADGCSGDTYSQSADSVNDDAEEALREVSRFLRATAIADCVTYEFDKLCSFFSYTGAGVGRRN